MSREDPQLRLLELILCWFDGMFNTEESCWGGNKIYRRDWDESWEFLRSSNCLLYTNTLQLIWISFDFYHSRSRKRECFRFRLCNSIPQYNTNPFLNKDFICLPNEIRETEREKNILINIVVLSNLTPVESFSFLFFDMLCIDQPLLAIPCSFCHTSLTYCLFLCFSTSFFV